MRLGGLALLERTSSSARYNLASYHDPRSITWSWILHWDWPMQGERMRLLRLNWWRQWCGFLSFVTLDLGIGRIGLSRQETMWRT